MDDTDALPIADLLDERRYLLDVASRLLGGAEEAERVVDEAYRRWYDLPDETRRRIAAPRSWLVVTVGRSCLSRLGRTESVRDDLFGTTPDRAAGVVGSGEPQYTEPAERARESVRTQRAGQTAPQEQDAAARAVRRACLTGDGELLASLLCARVTAFFDGGGKVRAPDRPVHGSRQVGRALLALLARRPSTTVSAQSVNGRTGLVVRHERRVAAVICLDVADQRVTHVWAILNPDKLRSWNKPPSPGPGPV